MLNCQLSSHDTCFLKRGHNKFGERLMPSQFSLDYDLRLCRTHLKKSWRKRVGVEPTGDIARCRPPVLKTGTITGPHALPLFTFNNIQLIY